MTAHQVPRPRLKLPMGIQTFRTIREEGYCYVDKTGIACGLDIRLT